MSLQSRLATLISAIGADIKADRARLTALEAQTSGPRCLLYKTGAQTITTSTFVPLVWEGEEEDLLGMHAANGTTITVPEAGIYFASSFVSFSVGSVSGRFIASIYVNGAESRGGFRHEVTMAAIGTAAWHTALPTGLFKLNAGDTLSVVLYQNTGGTLVVSSNSDNAKFSVFKVDVKGATGATGPQGLPGDSPTLYTLDTWHEVGGASQPAFQNSWVNYDNSAAVPGTAAQRNASFRKDPEGRVWLRGVVKNGTVGVPIFTLPTGYRPPKDMTALVPAGVDMGVMVISASTGAVYINNYVGGSNAYVYLDSISFDTGSVATLLAGPKGDVGLPPIVVRARKSVAQTLTAGGVFDKVTFPTEDADSDSFFDGTKFLPTRAGWYRISAGVNIDNITGTSSLVQLHLVKNQTGSAYPGGTFTEEARDRRTVIVANETVSQLELNQLVYFNGTTDYVEVFVSVVTGRVQYNGGTYFAVDSVGAAGPTGATGPAGPTGPAGSAGAAEQVPQISWQTLPIRTDAGGWTADGGAPPQWMLDQAGLIHLRGRVRATAGSGVDYLSAPAFLEPYTAPGANHVGIAGVNQTQWLAGAWEILSSALIWHGAKTALDYFGLDGIAYPSVIGGPLGKLVTPSMASGWTSDPTDPLKVWATDDDIRFMGSVLGSLPGSGNTLIFTVPGLSSYARTAGGSGMATTVSGADHPSNNGMDGTDFVVGTDGTVRVKPQFAGTDSVKLTFSGIYANR